VPEQVAAHQRGNINQEDTDKNATEHIKLGTTACKIKRKWEIWVKKAN
jgi:hypothetical protein